jgi:gamma-glutamyltranspeptidase / glutathione hydrolase
MHTFVELKSGRRGPSRWLAIVWVLMMLAMSVAAESTAADRLVSGRQGMVVSVSRPASEVGRGILRDGGNAVDAAVATALALAVTYPEAGNIGGGGFMLIWPGDGRPTVCVDYRETAPAAASENMYATQKSRLGAMIVGVPGTVRGLALAHDKYGRLPWKDLVEPAVKLAADGFAIDRAVAASLNKVLADSQDFAEFVRVYAKPNGTAWQAGDQLRQPDLARTLKAIAELGPDAFYRGRIAEQLVAEMQAAGGIITAADLAGYEAKIREPIHGTFRGFDIYAPPPPSSAGIALVEILNILESFDLARLGRWSPEANHLIIEAMRRAYRDRAAYLGDSDFVDIPEHLTAKQYAKTLAGQIDPARATPSESLAGDIMLADESPHTTHFSIVDSAGMSVANTYTLEEEFGSRVVVRGAGFLLNNQMGDFCWRPGVTDRQGTIGTPPNRIRPGKRMLSSQSPTIVARDGRLLLVTGSPGGRTIINTVLSVVLNVCEFQMDLGAAVDAPRMHQPWLPDRVQFEGALDPAYEKLVAGLRSRGHKVVPRTEPQGDAHSILVRDGLFWGAADRRTSGYAAGY